MMLLYTLIVISHVICGNNWFVATDLWNQSRDLWQQLELTSELVFNLLVSILEKLNLFHLTKEIIWPVY